ncbi:MAG: hypothetical protein MUE42_04720 [Opitutaceae bacterium]|jgi:hypothetical protein|nr:hypothetical protein [Opitutaceae bacterium]
MRNKAILLTGLALGAAVSPAFAQGSSKRQSPTSKFYVAEVKGFAQVNTGEKIEDLTEKSVFDAEGTVIETKPDSANALVMSNGAGLYFAPDTKMSVDRFVQEPFEPNRTDLDTEPSVSQTRNRVSRGSVGLCTSKLVAGSSMVYNTPHASVNVLSQSTQKVAMQIDDNSTTISLFEGAVTLRGDNMAGGETLQPGQQAIITPRGVNQPPIITIQPIPQEQLEPLGDMVNSACQARSKVYFDIADREVLGQTEADTLEAVVVEPEDPTEVGPIVSPARAP